MKDLQEILSQEPDDIIKDLKYKTVELPEWEDIEKEYEPSMHEIFDEFLHPNKPIYKETDTPGEKVIERYEPITRIGIGLQKLATRRLSQFMFTKPVEIIIEDDEGALAEQFKSFKRILRKNYWKTLNMNRCKITSSQCECAVYWYVVRSDRTHKNYGFETPFKLKHTIFSPANGDELYPLFDETGDMIAFSRRYEITDPEGYKKEYFETWTADWLLKYQRLDKWEQVSKIKNAIGKIPIIYTTRPKPIWQDADNKKVHEIEKILSENGEIISYHSAPVLFIKGELTGSDVKKGGGNKVFQGDADGDAKYVSWDQSPESVRFQFDTLMRTFWMELQLPDLSFENIKGVGAQSGESRKWLMVEPHLKCGEEAQIYNDAINREFNLIKAFMGEMNTAWRESINDMDLNINIIPYQVDDEKANIELLTVANGGKPVISQELSVKLSGLSEDPEADFEVIKKEAEDNRMEDVFVSAE